MSANKLPAKWCRNVEQMANQFLWDKGRNGKALVPIFWSRVCRPKSAGGLGLRRLKDMKMALLSKLGWFLANDANKLWVRALKAKYFVGRSFSNCPIKKNSSRSWRGILMTRQILEKGLCYRVGRGDAIDFWEDSWVPNNPNFKPIPKSEEARSELGSVSTLRCLDGSWNTE